ncbi:MAG: NAD(P)-dependent oxidoreductase [Crocinitomicaceae bacterium]|nr:NAD(P)-dependent oxidoreductase [Crocinitomicaceae bacterium]
MQKVGLTGSTGMIGRHMKCLLEFHNVECICIKRDSWNLLDWKTLQELDELFEEVDAIFHFGAALPKASTYTNENNQQTQVIFDANVRACLNLAEWAQSRDVPVVFLSGATVYDEPCAKKINETAPQVKNGFGGFYGYSKLLAEKVFDHFMECGLKLVILRPSSVYGVGLGAGKLISNYLNLASSNEIIKLESPQNRINLIHALDVSKAAFLALSNRSWGVYNVASEDNSSIQELAQSIVNVCGAGTIVINETLIGQAPFVRFDLDTSKATHAFSFKQTINLNEGLALMHELKEMRC